MGRRQSLSGATWSVEIGLALLEKQLISLLFPGYSGSVTVKNCAKN